MRMKTSRVFSIMDLMNKDLLMQTKDLLLGPVTTFRQDPKLVAAIDKLFSSKNLSAINQKEGGLLLPEKKHNFSEVQQLLSQSTNDIVRVEKPLNIMVDETNRTKKAIIKKVEDILEEINKTAESGETPKLVIRNQRLWGNCIYELDRVTLKTFAEAKKTTLHYSSTEDKNRFNRIVFVLTKVHELLSKNLIVTRRELFYQNVCRLRNQANLDVAVRDVCCLLECPPWDLGIVATSKGLIAGPLTIHTREGSVVECMGSNGILIMQDINGIKKFTSSAKYILVVEKDAVFQKLLDEGALVRLGPVIIITGKGYPDVCTRQLLCRLCSELRLPALALVDADPHGFEIFLTYKYGSLAQSHLSSSLACSSLSLLGVRHQDVMTLASKEARLDLSELDKRKLVSLFKRPYLDTPSGSLIKNELNAMLSSGVKAEIEALAPTSAALCDAYLPSKIIQAEYLG
ncbi:meiotic recombination protein SPO11 [Cydia splendana]|uniref:meiotic recombination protein SPO11 n=1 Tax=Cydia splendana TaxID=1100963 RepID=UPI00300D7B30